MDERLALLLAAQNGVFSTMQATRAGITSDELSGWTRRGDVTRVRRGAFVDALRYASAPEVGRYELRVRAVMAARDQDVAGHHAALVLRRLPLWQVNLGRIDIYAGVTASTSHGCLVVHPRGDLTVESVQDVPSVSTALAVVQTAANSGMESGVVAADAAANAGLCRVEDLRQAFDAAPALRGKRRVEAMLDAVDPRCESVGETRLRLLLRAGGLVARSQVRIVADAHVVARVDFLVGDRVIVEFDGAVKYAHDPSGRALFEEKRREDRLRALGLEVVRVTWADLDRPGVILSRTRAAMARAAARLTGGEAYP